MKVTRIETDATLREVQDYLFTKLPEKRIEYETQDVSMMVTIAEVLGANSPNDEPDKTVILICSR